jgi:hypothetical protein
MSTCHIPYLSYVTRRRAPQSFQFPNLSAQAYFPATATPYGHGDPCGLRSSNLCYSPKVLRIQQAAPPTSKSSILLTFLPLKSQCVFDIDVTSRCCTKYACLETDPRNTSGTVQVLYLAENEPPCSSSTTKNTDKCGSEMRGTGRVTPIDFRIRFGHIPNQLCDILMLLVVGCKYMHEWTAADMAGRVSRAPT